MSNILSQWKYIGIQGNTLRLGRGGETFSSTYFDDPRKKEALESLCKAFWGEHIVVELAEATADQSPPSPQKGTLRARTEVTRSQQIPEPVKKVLDTFEGKIISTDSGRGG